MKDECFFLNGKKNTIWNYFHLRNLFEVLTLNALLNKFSDPFIRDVIVSQTE